MASRKLSALKTLVGRPTSASCTVIGKNEAIIKLLLENKRRSTAVYEFYEEMVTLGWYSGNYVEFCAEVRQTNLSMNKTRSKIKSMPKTTTVIEVAQQPDPDLYVEGDNAAPIPDAAVCDEIDDMCEDDDEMKEGRTRVFKREIRRKDKQISKLLEEKFMGQLFCAKMREAASNIKPAHITLTGFDPCSATDTNISILPIADVHYGEIVNSTTVGFTNAYNIDIAEKRLAYIFQSNARYAKEHNCNELHVMLLGDLISGEIHESLAASNEETAFVCATKLSHILEGLILSQAQIFDKVVVSCVVGNHARNTKKLEDKNRCDNSFEHFIYDDLKFHLPLCASNIVVNYDKDKIIQNIEVGNQMWQLEHGDRYKGSTAAAGPINGIMRKVIGDMKENQADVYIMGHWHAYADARFKGFDNKMVNVMIVPSVVGPGEFSAINIHEFYPPETIMMISDGNKITAKTTLLLNDIVE